MYDPARAAISWVDNRRKFEWFFRQQCKKNMIVTLRPAMKMLKSLTIIALAVAYLVAPAALRADDKKAAKPYPLKTCIVSDEKLGEMGEPYVFTHEGQEIKLCCKSCLKDFKKDPAKYLKKLEGADKTDKKADKK